MQNTLIHQLTFFQIEFKKLNIETSLVVQWLRIHLGMQGTQVGSLMGTKILHAIEHVKAHCNTAPGPVPQPENLRAATKDPHDTTKILHATTNT